MVYNQDQKLVIMYLCIPRIKQSNISNIKSRQMVRKTLKNQDSKKMSKGPKAQLSKLQNRKGENPTQTQPITKPCSTFRGPVCPNVACQAVKSTADSFCRRCSCCICHNFDENKDPSLWFECVFDSCGLSSHIECALTQKLAGVFYGDGVTELDGGYLCNGCGKISESLGAWKRQLTIATKSRRADHLCDRVYRSYKLLNGTLRFQCLHDYVKQAKAKLESEMGPLGEISALMTRVLVRRLSVAEEVLDLCNAALRKADELFIPAAVNYNNNKNNDVAAVPQNLETSGAKDPEPDSSKAYRSTCRSTGLDLNSFDIPDLNEPSEEERSMGPTHAQPRGEVDHRSGGSESCAQQRPNEEISVVDSQAGLSEKRPISTEAHDSDSVMVHGPPLPPYTIGPNNLDEKFECCVRMIRLLECEGHITKEFRLKLLTWFSMDSTERVRRVVTAYIQLLEADPPALAEQLVHSFGYLVPNSNNKKPRT